MTHKFNYNWNLKDATFTKDKGKVFSCFACGGGSTMGYKLAGFDVIGCNEIDPKMMEAYRTNHNPKYSFLEPIQTFKNRDDLPKELFNLDILDGSPPCSSFSMAGNRDDDWGKEKKFREGQAEQVLDTLFFDFIDLAKKLQPKVVVAENVKGLLLGEAKSYVLKIYQEFEKAGYHVRHWLLDASTMGVPQRRERVFFLAIRNDIAMPFLEQYDMFSLTPKINLDFNEPHILYKEIEEIDAPEERLSPSISKYWDLASEGQSFSEVHPNGSMFNLQKANRNKVLPTISAHHDGGCYHPFVKRRLSKLENCLGGSYPLDYDFLDLKHKYLIGMSVPPIMTAQIASRIYDAWLSKL